LEFVRNDFSMLKAIYADQLKEVKKARLEESQASFRRKKQRVKGLMFKDFMKSCWRTDANVGPVASNIIEWCEISGVYEWKSLDLKVCDPELSIFAGGLIKLMKDVEKLHLISSSHIQVIKVLLCRNDAYRHEFNLHLNLLITGDAGTSKSHICELLETFSIPGTINSVTYKTAKADVSDEDDNNNCTHISLFLSLSLSLI